MLQKFKNHFKFNSEVKKYFFRSFILFIFSGFFGYFSARANMEEAKNALSQLAQNLKILEDASQLDLFLIIFLNNFFKSFLVLAGGALLALLPIFALFANGYLLGLIFAVTVAEIGFWSVFLNILPHGIFELPAFFIAAGYGWWLFFRWLEKIKNKAEFKPYFKESLAQFFRLVAPLILFAAFVEVFITPLIAGLVHN